MSWPHIKKIVLKCRLLLFYETTMNHFLIGLWHETKFYTILYDNQQWPAQRLDWEATLKHFPMPKLHQKLVVVTVWWSAAHLTHYSSLNPSKTITSEKYAQQINEMHQKLQGQQLVLVNSSVVQSCPTLCNPMDCSMPGFPVHRQLLVFTQAHVHWVGDAI